MACLSCTIRRRNEQMEMEMKRKWESMQREKKNTQRSEKIYSKNMEKVKERKSGMIDEVTTYGVREGESIPAVFFFRMYSTRSGHRCNPFNAVR